jgi:hypothetical protein
MSGTISPTRESTMAKTAQSLEEIDRRRLRALADADIERPDRCARTTTS